MLSKNHEYFIEILKEIRKRNIKAKLLLIGEGPDEQDFKEKIRKEQLDDMVIFYGTTNKVQELFMAMDVFLLPSHFEGLPIVGVEAQASGLPVILSDQIDRSAKLTDSVEFLDIKLNTAAKWVDVILKFRKRTDDRKCAYYF